MFKKAFVKILITSIAMVMICASFAYADSPLYTFDYMGKHIETYASYSVVDGEKSTSYRYYVKSGNLVVIDQNLNPTANDIFIHFSGGKSYIAVLTRKGYIVSLGTENVISYLVDFKNKDIKALAENITSSSTTMLFTYEDGSCAAYDCITGKKLYETEATEKKSSVSLSDYASEYISDFISGDNDGDSSTAASRAQGIVNTLEDSGMSLGELVDSGVIDGIASDYSEGAGEADYSDSYSYDEYLEGYDYTQDEDYQNLVASEAAQWSDEQLDRLKDLINQVSHGQLSGAEASEQLLMINPNGENAEGGVDAASDASDASGNAEVSGASDNDKNSSAASEELKKQLESYFSKLEDSAAESVSSGSESASGSKSAGSANGQKSYISSSKLSEKYVAVYSAEKEMYEIYSQEDMLENPENPTSELAGFGKAEQESLEKLLSADVQDNSSRGLKLLLVISLISLVIVLVLSRILKTRKQNIRPAGQA